MNISIHMDGVREHNEGDPVALVMDSKSNRLVIRAYASHGELDTRVDFLELMEWVRQNQDKIDTLRASM